jgi:hypothetical protein
MDPSGCATVLRTWATGGCQAQAALNAESSSFSGIYIKIIQFFQKNPAARRILRPLTIVSQF